MLHTKLCDLVGIEFPVIQAGMGVFTSAELVAAVSNAGGLGSLGTGLRPIENLRQELPRIRRLTERPFAVNLTLSQFNAEIWATILAAQPAVISFALAEPADLVKQAHDAGSLV